MSGQNAASAWVVSVMMGLGHMRAAYALRGIANGSIVIDGEKAFCSPEEIKLWKRIRQVYYFLSRAETIPLIGKYLAGMMYLAQSIPSYYPTRDLSAPTGGVRYLSAMIKKAGLSRSVIDKVQSADLPVVNTFYAAAMAIDLMARKDVRNYLLICDADFNRVWVPENPKKSRIKFLAPCTQVKRRLMAYGVPEENIFLTGFPLPRENIGSRERLEILKEDLFHRLVRLDPRMHFANFHERTVEYYLGKKLTEQKREDYFVLTFAVGGSGAQAHLAETILYSLREKIKEGKIVVNLVAGIRKEVYTFFKQYIDAVGLTEYLGRQINIVYDEDIFKYFGKFNATLRTTDVLWTKPSELSFYCALGIPILLAPTVGIHEELNEKWLQDVHAGVKPAGALEATAEWIFDLRDSGILAEAAWDGFLKGRKLGAYHIEDLALRGTFSVGNSPLER